MKLMIQSADELQPDTQWSETAWAHSREEDLTDDHSNPRLCVAALLPFKKGQPDWGSFERMLHWMMKCAKHFGVELTFVPLPFSVPGCVFYQWSHSSGGITHRISGILLSFTSRNCTGS